MRKDIYEGVQIHVNQNIKPNYAEIARQFGSDCQTVKNTYEKSIKKNSMRGFMLLVKMQALNQLLVDPIDRKRRDPLKL